MTSPKALVVIPARYGSTRLPGKPLLTIGGKPLIELVYRQALLIESASRVVVATDDHRIQDAVKSFGGEALMTSKDHVSGSDRIAEVAEKMPEYDIVVNIQGDEPFIDPGSVDSIIKPLTADPSLNVTTLCTPVLAEEAHEKNVTCVVRDINGYAIYFSRLPIPCDRDGDSKESPFFKHLGVYGFRSDFLLYYSRLDPTPLEKLEKLEQLRILEHGHKILCVETRADSIGVDSEEDLLHAEKHALTIRNKNG